MVCATLTSTLRLRCLLRHGAVNMFNALMKPSATLRMHMVTDTHSRKDVALPRLFSDHQTAFVSVQRSTSFVLAWKLHGT